MMVMNIIFCLCEQLRKNQTVSKFSDVCLLRLDFLTFQTLGTGGTNVDNEGDCMDTFTITVSSFDIILGYLCKKGVFLLQNRYLLAK